MTDFILPSYLEDKNIYIRPLNSADFEGLFRVASDPLIWEQHPNRQRYQRPVFEIYFNGAMESGYAFLVHNSTSGEIIGCSRYYDFNKINSCICIGYTFLSSACWGKLFNRSLKTAMLDYAFKFVNSVLFHVGHKNIRSQKAMEKLGAVKSGEEDMSYYGEPPHTNFIYLIEKKIWLQE